MNPHQTSKFVESLSKAIHIINEFRTRIIVNTEVLIAKIENMCIESLKDLEFKRQRYSTQLASCQKNELECELKEIEESIIPLELNDLSSMYKGFENSHRSEFLKCFYQYYSIPSCQTTFNRECDPHLLLEDYAQHVTCIAATPDNQHIISGSKDKTVRIWSLPDRKQEAILENHTSVVKSLAITSDSKYIVSGSEDRTVRIWNLKDRVQECVLFGHTGCVLSLAITSDNKYIISGSTDKTVRIWSFREKIMEGVLMGHTDGVKRVAITRDNLYIVSGSCDKVIRIWRIQDKQQMAALVDLKASQSIWWKIEYPEIKDFFHLVNLGS